jgi:hypothetical protein
MRELFKAGKILNEPHGPPNRGAAKLKRRRSSSPCCSVSPIRTKKIAHLTVDLIGHIAG